MSGSTPAADLDCEKWFFEAGVTPGTPNCLQQCQILPVDMGDFMCPGQCKALCSVIIPDYILNRLTFPAGLTKSDKDFIAKHPHEALRVFMAKIRAEKDTARIFGANGRNNESDAFRHCIWAALTTSKLGPDRTRVILENHERRPGQSPGERDMDMHNNEQGIALAVRLQKEGQPSRENLERAALQLLREKKLQVLNPKGQVPVWRDEY